MRRGLGRHMYRNSGNIFTPLSLFAAGEAGAWYDPSNFSTLFQDSAGTTPVTAVEQPVGLMLDGSKGLALGAELVTNGDFSQGTTGWTFTNCTGAVVNGQLQITSTVATGAMTATYGGATTVGATYKLSVDVVQIPSSGIAAYVGGATSGISSTTGTKTAYVVSASAVQLFAFQFTVTAIGQIGIIDNISVKALPGNHAFQTTSANRPTLSARYNLLTKSQQYDDAAWTKSNAFVQTNLLTYSQDFDNAAWSKSNITVSANTVAAPDGVATADTLTSSGAFGTIFQTASSTSATFTYSVYVRPDTATTVELQIAQAGNGYKVSFNLTSGAAGTATVVGTGGTVSAMTGAIVSAGGGWYRCSVSYTSGGIGNAFLNVPSAGVVYAWGAQLVQGSVPGDYRATTSAALPVLYSDPIGGVTAEKLCETTVASTQHSAAQTASIANGIAATYTAILKAGERTYAAIYAGTPGQGTIFNLANGTVFGSIVAPPTSSSIVSVGGGFYRCSITYTTTTTSTSPSVYVCDNTGAFTYTGDGTSGIYVWGSDIRPANDGVGLPAYQRVNTSTDYDTAGFPPYLLANGSTTSLATNSIDFSATNKMTVWAGVRKLSDANPGMLAELSASIATNNGAFYIPAPDGTASPSYNWASKGTTLQANFVTGYASPLTNVLTGIGDISGPASTLRINGSQVATNTASQGTGNYGNYPLYIGARAGTSLFFNGRLYSLIVRGASTTATTLSSAETWVNSKTKAY